MHGQAILGEFGTLAGAIEAAENDGISDLWRRTPLPPESLAALPPGAHVVAEADHTPVTIKAVTARGPIYIHCPARSASWPTPATADDLADLAWLAARLGRPLGYSPSFQGGLIVRDTYILHPAWFHSTFPYPVPLMMGRLHWHRPLRGDEAGGWLHCCDARAAYLIAATIPLPYGEAVKLDLPIWQLPPAQCVYKLGPSSVGSGLEPLAGPGWYADPWLRAWGERRDRVGIGVAAAYAHPHRAAALRPWAEAMLTLREAADTPGRSALVKLVYTRTLGMIGRRPHPDGSPPDPRGYLRQPHWLAWIVAESARRRWAYLRANDGAALDADMVAVPSPSSPEQFAVRPEFHRGRGGYALVRSLPITPDLIALSRGDTTKFLAYLRKGE